MGVNKYQPHLFVLPEDDANRQIVNGFIVNPALNARAIQVLPSAGGWMKIVEAFKNSHSPDMARFPERRILLIVDFDHQASKRLLQIQNGIPRQLMDRVFILGTLSEPENLRNSLGRSFEDIGKGLAEDCADDTRTVWEHDLLRHNKVELDRMILSVKPFLFN
jgi:hypothetical protein